MKGMIFYLFVLHLSSPNTILFSQKTAVPEQGSTFDVMAHIVSKIEKITINKSCPQSLSRRS